MTIPFEISKKTVITEIKNCEINCKTFGWEISDIDELSQTFTVKLTSAFDQEIYILEFKFDDYPSIPYFIEFIDPVTNEKATRHAYPKSTDSFFHPNLAICHQCSRKSYTILHTNDWSMEGWRKQAGDLTNLNAILNTIYIRISNKDLYGGRMDKKI